MLGDHVGGEVVLASHGPNQREDLGFAGRRVPDGSGGAFKESEGSKREKSSAESAWEKSDAMEVGTFDVEELGKGASW